MIELLGSISTLAAIAGSVFNNRKLMACWPLFLLSNSIALGIHAYLGPWAYVVRDAAFIALAIDGWRRWRMA